MRRSLTLFFCLSLIYALSGQDLYDIYQVKEVRLTLPHDDWEQKLDSLKMNGKDQRLAGTLVFDEKTYEGIGVRYKGNSSYFNVRKSGSSKLPFNIKVDYVIDAQTLPGKYGSLKLSNVFRDPSFLREVLSYEVARKYMPAPKANFVRLYVNDEFLGLYNSTESVDKKFLKENFGEKTGIFFKCDPSWNATPKGSCPAGHKASLNYLSLDTLCYQGLYEIKSEHGWGELVQLARTLKNRPGDLEQHLDVNAVLWMHAFNNVMVNLDSYAGRLCHNYYLYQDSFGIWHPILWDMNLSLGGFRYDGTGTPLSNKKMQTLSPFLHYKTAERPLISVLLANPLYRKMYIAHVRTIMEDYLTNGELMRRAESLQKSIDHYVKTDENKLYSYEAFQQNLIETTTAGKSKIIGLKELVEGRTAYLSNHPLLKKPGPKIENPAIAVRDTDIAVTVKTEGAQKVYLTYREKKHHPWKRKLMQVNESGQYELVLPKKEIKHYYIVAEAEKRATCSPARAGVEYHKTK